MTTMSLNPNVFDQSQIFAAKLSFQEEDLEYLVSRFSQWEKGVNSYFRVISQKFGWWELLSKDEILYAYRRTQDGIDSVVNSDVFITNPSDGQYYLYIYHY